MALCGFARCAPEHNSAVAQRFSSWAGAVQVASDATRVTTVLARSYQFGKVFGPEMRLARSVLPEPWQQACRLGGSECP